MKRLAVLVTFITVALVLPSSGALAKKGSKPATSYDVTMTFGSTNEGGTLPGLATTCGEADGEIFVIPQPGASEPVLMTGSLNNVLSAAGVFVEMMVPIDWWRDYDAGWGAPTLDEPNNLPIPFTGCHGLSQSSTEPPDPFDGALWLTFGKDSSGNDTVIFQWRFDYYWRFGEPVQRGKKDRYPQEVLEIFELRSDAMVWEDDGTVSGPFTVTLFTKTGAEGITHFWDLVGASYLSFNLSITPR